MCKKILLICSVFFVFLIGLCDVNAKEVICKYKKYKLEFEVSGKTVELVYASENNKRIDATIMDDIKLKNESECPNAIYIIENDTEKKIYTKPQGLNHQSYNLINYKVYCGREEQGRITGIPKKIPELTSLCVTIVQIAIPIILVLLGSIDLFKGVTAGKEDEMKKGQQIFIKRLILAAIIFFVVVIVKFLVSVIADANQDNISDCIDCFVSNDCEEM